MNTQLFSYTGSEQIWTVPPGITFIQVDLSGGKGGNTADGVYVGGLGGRVVATINVIPLSTIYIYVGGSGTGPSTTVDENVTGGFNGGGQGGYDENEVNNGASGGGSSDIRIGDNGVSHRVLVAGGGGGAARLVSGGAGGENVGAPGGSHLFGQGGGGGTQSMGGNILNTRGSSDGNILYGGNATHSYAYGSGGGGGGYYGGAAGSSSQDHGNGHAGGGGGGSNYTSGTNITDTQNYIYSNGNGSVRINYIMVFPYITGTTGVSDNSTLTTIFSESVFNTNGATGNLQTTDFALIISDGQATLSSSTPTSISKTNNSYTLGIPLNGTPNGSEVVQVNPVSDSIFDDSGNAAATSQSNNTITLVEKVAPIITGTTILSNNSQIIVTFNEPVFNTNSGSGNLQTIDFNLLINNGVATLLSTTPNSISKSNNSYLLSVPLIGIPNGLELLTIAPIVNSIFDSSGNVASTTQNNNTIYLNDKLTPTITNTIIDNNNSVISVIFSDNIFDTPIGSGNLEISDFTLTKTGGVATVANAPTNITKISNTTYNLGISVTGIPNGSEQVTVNIIANSIYDQSGNIASTTQSNNTVNLKDKILPIITLTTLASNNETIDVTFSEPVYNTNGGIGALETTDFSFNIARNNGNAELSQTTPSSISVSNNTYTLGLDLYGLATGTEVVTLTPILISIFDKDGNAASTIQSNNTITLNDKLPAYITNTTINNNNNLVTITFNDAVSRSNVSNLPLEVTDFSLNITGGVATLDVNTPISISVNGNNYTLGFTLIGTLNGNEVLSVNPILNSIFDLNGNISTISQTNNTITLMVSKIINTVLSNDNQYVTVSFNEPVYTDAYANNPLIVSDFTYYMYNGVARLDSTIPVSIDKSNNDYKLGVQLSGVPNGLETLVVKPSSNTSIYNNGGIPSLVTQSNNTVLLNEKIVPYITNTTINNNNDIISVTFSEPVFDTSGGTGSLKTSDLSYNISNGVATLASTQPTSISKNGNTYLLGININGIAIGTEIINVSPIINSIYDSSGNIANVSQYNNTVLLNEKIIPYVTSVTNINNNTISITFNEPVVDSNSDNIKTSDLSLNIYGGVATLSSTQPSSIIKSGNNYIIRIPLVGTSDGNETLVIIPKTGNSIFDLNGNAVSIIQTNKLVSLNETIPPIITNTTLSVDNSTITVTFSEPIYNTANGSGNIEVSDFQLSITGGMSQLAYNNPYNISKLNNSYILGIPLLGLASGSEILTITPNSNSIYDLVGNVALTSQINNTVILNHKLGPIISSSSINHDNTIISVSFTESVYSQNNSSGNLDVNDFILNMFRTGSATLVSTTPTSISLSNNTYSLGLYLLNIPNGSEQITILPNTNSIYDSSGNNAIISNQTNNVITLNEKNRPTMTSISINSNNTLVSVTFSETVYNTNNGSGNLEISDFMLNLNEGADINLISSYPTSISSTRTTYTLGIQLSTLGYGTEMLTVSPIINSIYDSNGNDASNNQSNNTIILNKTIKPFILETTINHENTLLTTKFNEPVFRLNNGSGNLQRNNFKFTLTGGSATLVSSIPISLTNVNNTYTLGINLTGIPNGSELLSVIPYDNNSVFDLKGNSSSTTQTNNSINLNEKIVPSITKISVSSNNDSCTLTFNEPVYSNETTGSELTVYNFLIKSNCNQEILISETPDSIEKNGNSYTLYFTLNRVPTSGEGIYITLRSPICDTKGNILTVFEKNNNILFNLVIPIPNEQLMMIKNNTSRLTKKKIIGNKTHSGQSCVSNCAPANGSSN